MVSASPCQVTISVPAHLAIATTERRARVRSVFSCVIHRFSSEFFQRSTSVLFRILAVSEPARTPMVPTSVHVHKVTNSTAKLALMLTNAPVGTLRIVVQVAVITWRGATHAGVHLDSVMLAVRMDRVSIFRNVVITRSLAHRDDVRRRLADTNVIVQRATSLSMAVACRSTTVRLMINASREHVHWRKGRMFAHVHLGIPPRRRWPGIVCRSTNVSCDRRRVVPMHSSAWIL